MSLRFQLFDSGRFMSGCIAIFAIAVLLSTSTSIHAQSDLQSLPQASLSEAGVLQIPTGELKETYILDVSHMHFSSREEMVAFFSELSCEEFLMRAIPSQGKAVLSLKCSNHPDWNCSNWNELLQLHCTEHPVEQ